MGAAGTVEQLAAFADQAPARARLIPLSVAGAFHTEHMAPAQAHLAHLAEAMTTHEPRTRILSNADGQVVSSGREYLQRMVAQITNPVRWDLCLEAMGDLGVTGLLELPPSGTLTGIAKRNLKGVELFALNGPDQLDAARAFVVKHSDASVDLDTATPTWMMVVSPAKGEFHRSSDVGEAGELASGATIGAVANLRESIPVASEHGGQITEWLVHDGDLVSPGQPLVRLYPTTES